MNEQEKTMPADPYQVLGISRRAGDEDIKRAYFALVRQHPPEREPEKFREIRAAFDMLRSQERRARTDLFLLQPPAEPPSRRGGGINLAVQPQDLLCLAFEVALAELSWQKEFREPQLP